MSSINQHLRKIPLVFFGAGCMTVSLFFVMQILVKADLNSVRGRSPVQLQPITIVQPPIEIRKKAVKPPPPPPIVDIDRIDFRTLSSTSTSPTKIHLNELVTLVPVLPSDTNGVDVFIAEGTARALRQVSPMYPARAISRGIEGFVLVEFDISPEGTVVNARVIYAEPERVFDSAALKAIARWSFLPKIENGKEVFQYSERRKISFTLND